MAHLDHLHIVHIVRCRNDYLIALVQHGQKSQIQSFHGTNRDHDFGHRVIAETLLAHIIFTDGLPQYQQTRILRITGFALTDGLTGSLLDGNMGLHIGIAQGKIHHILHLFRHIENTANQGRFYRIGDIRNRYHKFIVVFFL